MYVLDKVQDQWSRLLSREKEKRKKGSKKNEALITTNRKQIGTYIMIIQGKGTLNPIEYSLGCTMEKENHYEIPIKLSSPRICQYSVQPSPCMVRGTDDTLKFTIKYSKLMTWRKSNSTRGVYHLHNAAPFDTVATTNCSPPSTGSDIVSQCRNVA